MRVGQRHGWHAEGQPENRTQKKETSAAQEASQHKAEADPSSAEAHDSAQDLPEAVEAEQQPSRSEPAEPHGPLADPAADAAARTALSAAGPAAEPAAQTSSTFGDVTAGHAEADAMSNGTREAGKKEQKKRRRGTACHAGQMMNSGSSAEPVGTSTKKKCKVNSFRSVCCRLMERHIRQHSIDCTCACAEADDASVKSYGNPCIILKSWGRGSRCHSRMQCSA